MIPAKEDVLKAAKFKTSRSGGKGGQNVNKVSSKVELVLNLDEAFFLDENERLLLKERLASRLDSEGNLHITAQEDRSQLLNKERTILKLIALFKSGLKVQKIRKATKIPKSVIRKRLADKELTAVKKENRRRPGLD
jgi:ribosome-associated protein